MSRVDQFWRRISLDSIFTGGWGAPEGLNKIVNYRRNWVGNRETCAKLVPSDYKTTIDKEFAFSDHTILEGSFPTPFVNHIPELIPDPSKTCRFQFIVPKKFKHTKHKPVVFHFAGTGDQQYWRRRLILAKPLMTEYSVASLLIENPFYGARKPKEQIRSNLIYVKDLFVMGGLLVTESLVLMRWLEKLGYGPFAFTGLSMGGHMACLGATVWHKPVALIPCLSWTTAATVFTRGVMSSAISWDKLEKQYYSDKRYKELKDKLKELHKTENQKRAAQNKFKICPFSSDSEVKFSKLLNFNNLDEKRLEILEFMHLLMDECTHLLHYDVPVDTSLVYALVAKDDAYVLRDGVNDFNSIWPESKVEYIVDQGHVSAFLLSQKKFRVSIINVLNDMIKKHYS